MTSRSVGHSANDDVLKAYFDQIKNTELLSFEEGLTLSRRIQAGDDEARRELITRNLRLVVRIARSMCKRPDASLPDLIQEGNLGLLTAASKYDYRKKMRFSTYASWWIRQSIARHLSSKQRAVRIPHRKEEQLRKISKARTDLQQTLMRNPTGAEVAEETKMTEHEIGSILNVATRVVSLNAGSPDDSGCLLDVIESTSFAPDREFLARNLRQQTMAILQTLQEKEQQILLYRYALHGGKKHTLKSIGERVGISPQSVRQTEIKALKKLRGPAEELRDYVYSS